MERDLLAGVAHLGPEVVAVQGHQPLAGDQAQPEERGQRRVGGVLAGAAEHVELGLLEHVGGVDAALEPAVEPQPDHPPQPVAVAGEELDQGAGLPGAGAAESSSLELKVVRSWNRP